MPPGTRLLSLLPRFAGNPVQKLLNSFEKLNSFAPVINSLSEQNATKLWVPSESWIPSKRWIPSESWIPPKSWIPSESWIPSSWMPWARRSAAECHVSVSCCVEVDMLIPLWRCQPVPGEFPRKNAIFVSPRLPSPRNSVSIDDPQVSVTTAL